MKIKLHELKTIIKTEISRLNEINDPKSIDAIAATIADLTDNNDHSGSIVALCKFLKNPQWLTIATSLENIHNALGNFPTELGKFRSEFLVHTLIPAVTKKYGTNASAKIHSAF
jgi:hypothetical protein